MLSRMVTLNSQLSTLFECNSFGVVYLAVEAASSVVVGDECYDFHVVDDYVEVADFFRELVAESHFVFVVRSENEFLSQVPVRVARMAWS